MTLAMERPSVLQQESTVTRKGQTTIPKPIRDALDLHEGDSITFNLDAANGVQIKKTQAQTDPVIQHFLAFLARSIIKEPDMIQGLTPELASSLERLLEGVEANDDEEITGPVSL